MNLINKINDPLTKKDIFVFDSEFERDHARKHPDHRVESIPKGYTLMDVLAYLFDNDVISIAEVLSDYENGIEAAIDFMDGVTEGIKYDLVCIRCVRGAVDK